MKTSCGLRRGYRVMDVPFFGEPVTSNTYKDRDKAETLFNNLATLALKQGENKALFLYEHDTVVRRMFVGGW